MNLETSRLALVPTPLHVVRRRLAEDAFTESVDAPEGPRTVTFSAEWPGDPLPMFPGFADWLEANPGAEQWGGIVLLKETWEAVGQAGFKGGPDADGAVEVGYGINGSFWNRGFATEVVAALVAFARHHEQIRAVKAETSVHNIASRRVLEKNGFVVTGQRMDPDDGLLDLWVWSEAAVGR